MKSFVTAAVSALLVGVCSAEWSLLYNNVMTVACGVDVTPTSKTVYVAGGANGVGAKILRSHDEGATWENCAINSNEGMFMDIAMGSEAFGIAGGLGMYHALVGSASTNDGENWYSTPDSYFIAASQNVESLDNSTYFIVGAWQEELIGGEYKEGVRASFDGGNTLEEFVVSAETWVRYGAFPTKDTWYLSCGYWETSAKSKKRLLNRQPFTQHIELKDTRTKNPRFEINLNKSAEPYYGAEILKTTDGGATWQTLFLDFGQYYFNGISCPTVNHCIIVGEGDEGSYIFVSTDGGANWSETNFIQGGALTNIDMLNDKEGWAVGAYLVGATFKSLCLHTLDGGFTWEESNSLDNLWPNSVAIVDSGLAFATAFTRSGSSAILVYRADRKSVV